MHTYLVPRLCLGMRSRRLRLLPREAELRNEILGVFPFSDIVPTLCVGTHNPDALRPVIRQKTAWSQRGNPTARK
ncbi:hypothetical protein DENIS_3929 [Desulfonema ishimotonii]|uniref:Uncharacterized protein n=1 Tax=Desulfonema ishimotonii TaxID=45657 RepID=A0A401G154_9BACT|nr:hypothetical protein DENIS_3929 [Desulfonema ishimotonii]